MGLQRATHSAGADRIEQAGSEFHARVNDAFVELAHEDPERIRVVVSSASKEDTCSLVFAAVADLFPDIADFVLLKPAIFSKVELDS